MFIKEFNWNIHSSAYASVISPPGTSATIQGLVAGMDDGLGFSIGALFGGFLFQKIGGKQSFKIFALMALITCVAHIVLRPASTHEIRVPKKEILDREIEEIKDDAVEGKKLTESWTELIKFYLFATYFYEFCFSYSLLPVKRWSRFWTASNARLKKLQKGFQPSKFWLIAVVSGHLTNFITNQVSKFSENVAIQLHTKFIFKEKLQKFPVSYLRRQFERLVFPSSWGSWQAATI